MIYIESKENSLFKSLRKLKERKFRQKENKFILEGLRLIEEAAKAEMDIEYLILIEGREDILKNSTLLKESMAENKVFKVSKNLFLQLASTENPQGIIAIVKNKKFSIEMDGSFFLICDKVQDPGNLGTIIRTAHASGVDGIILTKGTVDIYNDKTIRSTMGSIFYVPIFYDDKEFNTIRKLKENGVTLVTTSLNESKNFFEEDLRGKIALAVGNEGNGISEELFDLADKKVKIPMPGGSESLNVGVATSIILFEKVRQNLIYK